MKTKALAALCAVFLVACGHDASEQPSAAPGPNAAPPSASAPAAKHSDSGLLYGVLGYMLGRSGSRDAVVAQQPQAAAPVRGFVDRPENLQQRTPQPQAQPKRWFKDDPVPDPAPTNKPAAPAPSMPAATKSVAPPPAPPRPTPSFSGPSSYKPASAPRVTYSTPSRGGRR